MFADTNNVGDLGDPDRFVDADNVGNPVEDPEDQEVRELLELASSMVDAPMADVPVSNLETAIVLFREALEQCPPSHRLRLQLLKDLSGALGVCFMDRWKLEDLQYSLSLCTELAEGLRDIGGIMPTLNDEGDDEILDMIKLARATVSEFRQTAVLSDLETAILLFEKALALSPSSNSMRKRLLASLAQALFLRFCYSDDLHDITSALSHLCEAVEICSADDPIYLPLNYQPSCSFGEKFNRTSRLSYLDKCLSRGSTQKHEPDNSPPDIPKLLDACQLCAEFRQSGNLDQLNAAITIFQEGFSKLPFSDIPLRVLINNVVALAMRFNRVGDHKDLDDSISMNEILLRLLPLEHPLLCSAIDCLANSRWFRHLRDAKQEDLDMYIMLSQQAFELRPPSDLDRYISLNNLTNGLYTRYALTGQLIDLDEAIEFRRQALDLRPLHYLEDRASSLNDLADALIKRYGRSGVRADLDEAILSYREVEHLQPPHPLRLTSSENLAGALIQKYEEDGKMEDLEEAISLNRTSLELKPPKDPSRIIVLTNLASALSNRFKQDGKMEDLEESISLNRIALELQPPEDPQQDIALSNLAAQLSIRFNQQGQHKDLDDAISYEKQALLLQPMSHPERYISINNLAGYFEIRFNENGQRSDLDEAIALLRQAFELLPPSHHRRSSILSNLGCLIMMRFDHDGCQSGDLDDAIMLLQEALKLQPPPHPARSASLTNLGTCFSRRFEKDNRRPDLEKCILLHREVIELSSSNNPMRPTFLNNLAVSLVKRFDLDQQPMDIYEAAHLYQESLKLRPPGYVGRYIALCNLSRTLKSLFKLDGQRNDLDQAISLLREALTLVSADHLERAAILNNLASALMTLYDEQQDPLNYGLIDEAMSLFRESTETGSSSPFSRFRQAKEWAREADRRDHLSAMDAYKSAIELLPQLAALSSDTQSRQKALTSRTAGLAQNAAACAIRRDELERAIEFLEAGRAVFWAQALQLRTPMDDLKEINPDLERRLRNIALSLEIASHREDRQAEAIDNQTKIRAEAESTRLCGLNDEWNAALDEARQMKGFENFLKPRKFSDLRVAALNGPIVTVVPDESATHILILTENGVKYSSCPELSLDAVHGLVRLMQVAIKMSGFAGSSERLTDVQDIAMALSLFSTIEVQLRNSKLNASKRAGRLVQPSEHSMTQDEIFDMVLLLLWFLIVGPVVKILGLQKSDHPETLVRWCLTGPFTFLPMHAAGCYDFECASDYLISSYIPTISALLLNPSHLNFSPEPLKMLAVIQSKTLPATKREMEMIEKHVPPSCLTKLGVPGTPAGVEDVASHLSSASIVHFACHGIQNPFNPLESALILDDGQLRISRIMKQPLPNASLAFLCACQTAMGDGKLPDEMISLATALLYSGFSNVIGTMWSIADEDGPSVAETFYEHLRDENGWLDTKKTAKALHIAVKRLRDNNIPFLRWVPFIHLSR